MSTTIEKPVKLSPTLFAAVLQNMKRVLNLGEFRFKQGSNEFKFFREQVMEITWSTAGKLYQDLESAGVVQRCECESSMRNGWDKCPHCAGSGYRDTATNQAQIQT